MVEYISTILYCIFKTITDINAIIQTIRQFSSSPAHIPFIHIVKYFAVIAQFCYKHCNRIHYRYIKGKNQNYQRLKLRPLRSINLNIVLKVKIKSEINRLICLRIDFKSSKSRIYEQCGICSLTEILFFTEWRNWFILMIKASENSHTHDLFPVFVMLFFLKMLKKPRNVPCPVAYW